MMCDEIKQFGDRELCKVLEILTSPLVPELGILVVVLVATEVLLKRIGCQYTVSTALAALAHWVRRAFEWIGTQLARLGGLLDIIDLTRVIEFVRDIAWDVLRAVVDITLPIAQVVVSPWYTITAYVRYAKTYTHPLVVPIGSAILFIVALFAAHYAGALNTVILWVIDVPLHYYIAAGLVIMFCSIYFDVFGKPPLMENLRTLFYPPTAAPRVVVHTLVTEEPPPPDTTVRSQQYTSSAHAH